VQWVNGRRRRVRGHGRYENGSRSSSSSSSGNGSDSGSSRSRISQAWATCQFLAVLCVYRAGRRLMLGGGGVR
jgi:hypothetical protein